MKKRKKYKKTNKKKRKNLYPTERKGEKIKEILKKSPALIFWPIIWFIIGFLFLIAVIIFWGFSLFFSITFLFWAIILGGLLFYNIYLMARSVTILTNQRIIDIEQIGMFSKRVNELELKSAERVAYKKTGTLAKLFNAGSVYVFIKETNQFLPIEYIREPEESAGKIEEIINKS